MCSEVDQRIGWHRAVALVMRRSLVHLLADGNQLRVQLGWCAGRRLSADAHLEEVQAVRGVACRVDEHGGLAAGVLKHPLQGLFHGSVERVSGAKKHRVQVVVLLQVLLVEGELAIGLRWFAELLHGVQPLGPKVGGNAFDAPQTVRTGFGTQAHLPRCGEEVRLDVARHEAAFLGL